MKQLETFLRVVKLAVARDSTRRDRDAALTLIRLRRLSAETLGPEGAARARALREAVLAQASGNTAPGHQLRIERLIAEIEAMEDHRPAAPYWTREGG